MQFRGYSLPVHHCSGTMGPSPCPISWALILPRDLFRLLAIGMCHFLPLYHLGIAYLGRGEGQNITKGWCWLCVIGELETGTDCYILTQSSSDHSSTSFSSWLGLLNRGSLMAASPQSSSWFSRWLLVPQLELQLALELELTQAVCGTWLYNFLRPPASCGRTHLHRIQQCPQVKVIFRYLRPDAPVSLIYPGASLDWRLGRESIYYKCRLVFSTAATCAWKSSKNRTAFVNTKEIMVPPDNQMQESRSKNTESGLFLFYPHPPYSLDLAPNKFPPFSFHAKFFE